MPTDLIPTFFGDVNGNKEHFFTPNMNVKNVNTYHISFYSYHESIGTFICREHLLEETWYAF